MVVILLVTTFERNPWCRIRTSAKPAYELFYLGPPNDSKLRRMIVGCEEKARGTILDESRH